MKILKSGIFLMGCVLANVASAVSLQECRALEAARFPIEKQLECYKKLALELAPTSASVPVTSASVATQASVVLAEQNEQATSAVQERQSNKEPCADKDMKGCHLLTEWNPNHPDGIIPYKQNYLLYANSSNPNNMPTSPNPNNQVPFSYPLNNQEAKFQISFKGKMKNLGESNSLWLAYTQQSFWQIFDASHSRPFRESNYEPEIIFSHRELEPHPDGPLKYLKIVNAGFVHQSNGQSNPRSRSWNRAYLQLGFEKNDGKGNILIVQPKIWARVFQEKDPLQNDNPDITHYLGYGELEVRYLHDKTWQFSAIARIRSLQADVAYSLHKLGGSSDFNLYFQYFTGYGESLIDYNQRHSTFGVGISMPY